MHKIFKALGLRQLIVEHLSILQQEVAMRQARLVPGKHDMAALLLALKEAEIKAKAIPVHMHQGHIETQQLKYNNETSTVLVHVVHIKNHNIIFTH